MTKDDNLVLTRVVNGMQVACCEIMRGVDESEILAISVKPSYRRQGLAQSLLFELFDWARQHQRQAIWLEVRASNAGAIALYDKLGFKRIRIRQNYYANQDASFEDAIVMKYTL